MIQWTCVQLCRCMDKPSEAAWNSALHCLHYLYSIRDSGVRFRSDGNAIPFAMYDSGHLQDRIDYKSFYGYIIVARRCPTHRSTIYTLLSCTSAPTRQPCTASTWATACTHRSLYRYLQVVLHYEASQAQLGPSTCHTQRARDRR
eukprot:COSAG02_NODE_160_length_32694_cov_18.496947_17_plen_145_part_00